MKYLVGVAVVLVAATVNAREWFVFAPAKQVEWVVLDNKIENYPLDLTAEWDSVIPAVDQVQKPTQKPEQKFTEVRWVPSGRRYTNGRRYTRWNYRILRGRRSHQMKYAPATRKQMKYSPPKKTAVVGVAEVAPRDCSVYGSLP